MTAIKIIQNGARWDAIDQDGVVIASEETQEKAFNKAIRRLQPVAYVKNKVTFTTNQ